MESKEGDAILKADFIAQLKGSVERFVTSLFIINHLPSGPL
jgi:hypothetical protein